MAQAFVCDQVSDLSVKNAGCLPVPVPAALVVSETIHAARALAPGMDETAEDTKYAKYV